MIDMLAQKTDDQQIDERLNFNLKTNLPAAEALNELLERLRKGRIIFNQVLKQDTVLSEGGEIICLTEVGLATEQKLYVNPNDIKAQSVGTAFDIMQFIAIDHSD